MINQTPSLIDELARTTTDVRGRRNSLDDTHCRQQSEKLQRTFEAVQMQVQTHTQTLQQGMRQDDCVSELSEVARPRPSQTRQAHRTDRRARYLVLRQIPLESRRGRAAVSRFPCQHLTDSPHSNAAATQRFVSNLSARSMLHVAVATAVDACGRQNHSRFSAPHSAEDVSPKRAARETPRRHIALYTKSLVFDSVTRPKVASPSNNEINSKKKGKHLK